MKSQGYEQSQKVWLIVCGFKIKPSPEPSILNGKEYPDPIWERFSHAYLEELVSLE